MDILHAVQICFECSCAARAAGGQQWARAAVPVSGSFWAESIFNSQSRWSQKLKRAWSDLRGDGRSHAAARMIWFPVMIWSQSTYQLQTCPLWFPEQIVLKNPQSSSTEARQRPRLPAGKARASGMRSAFLPRGKFLLQWDAHKPLALL